MTVLRVVRGSATPEELAAVVALLTAGSGAAPSAAPVSRSLWGTPALRESLTPGPQAWRTSSLPR